jgi:hypothetical protein
LAPEHKPFFFVISTKGKSFWDEYLKIQKRIAKNGTPPKSQASQVIREGSALLQRLAICGNCGRSRM